MGGGGCLGLSFECARIEKGSELRGSILREDTCIPKQRHCPPLVLTGVGQPGFGATVSGGGLSLPTDPLPAGLYTVLYIFNYVHSTMYNTHSNVNSTL